MTITAQQFAVFLEPGLRNIWHESWPPRPQVYPRIFNIGSMSKLTETDAKMAGFGNLQVQNEGASVIYDDPLTPVTKNYTKTTKALGYRVTDDMVRGELYGQAERLERDLMAAAEADVEQAGADIFNNGFGTTNTGFDGLQLFSTAHTRLDGGAVQRNRPSTDVDLSLSALQDAVIDFRNWRNDRGRPFMASPRLLVIHPDNMIVADEILSSTGKPGTANNDINAIRRFGLDFVVWDYLTDSDAWFLIGDEHDLNFMWWFRPETGMEVEFDTNNIKRKLRQSYALGFGEFRGTWGTSGG